MARLRNAGGKDPGPPPLIVRGGGPGVDVGYFTDSILVSGALRLPQNFLSSTLSLVIAAPGILMFGPQLSIDTVDSRPITLYLPALISSLFTTLSANMARAAAWAKSGCSTSTCSQPLRIRSRPTGAPLDETSITSPGFLPLASSAACAATARCAACTKIRSMSGLATI